MHRSLLLLALLLVSPQFSPLLAQKVDPVQWALSLTPTVAKPGATVHATFRATVDPGYHLYSTTTQGANPTQLSIEDNPAVASVEIYQPKPVRKFDANFQLDTETYDGDVNFLLVITLKPDVAPGEVVITAKSRYQACTETTCLLPKRKTASATLKIDPAATTSAPPIGPGMENASAPKPPATQSKTDSKPAPAQADESLWAFLSVALGFGLASVFTPCVFPVIPLIFSTFLDQSQKKQGSLWMMALVFCLGMITFFTGIGLTTTAALGPFGVIQLTANPWVNLVIATIFIVLAISMMGAFELTLPSGLLTKLNNASGSGGYFGALLMGLTFALTAFACVGPFMGTLLVGSLQGGPARPALGMAAFSSGLAAPFLLLGFFPALLNRMPRSGAWLARVKMVMGFVVLAAALKYLSNADQVWQLGILTRERFLAIWFVLFLLPGLYLLGKVRLEGVKPEEQIGWGRLLIATFFLAFAISLLPGMFGAKLGELEGYVPFANESSVSAGGASSTKLAFLKNDYAAALAKAKAENKPLFISFTGYACTNCHWMKANMLPRPAVQAKLGDFVLLELYTDGADPASEQNQQIQESRFNSVAIPLYAILSPDEKILAVSQGLQRDEAKYLAFLNEAITAR